MCLEHNIQLTEQLAEQLTPDKDQVDDSTRIEILQKIGQCLFLQGDYHMATKKFTQAGDKVCCLSIYSCIVIISQWILHSVIDTIKENEYLYF